MWCILEYLMNIWLYLFYMNICNVLNLSYFDSNLKNVVSPAFCYLPYLFWTLDLNYERDPWILGVLWLFLQKVSCDLLSYCNLYRICLLCDICGRLRSFLRSWLFFRRMTLLRRCIIHQIWIRLVPWDVYLCSDLFHVQSCGYYYYYCYLFVQSCNCYLI